VGARDTFSSNQDVRGWEGANGTSQCGEYGHLLGGAGVLGDSSSLRKTYTNLCKHDKVVIQFSVVLIDGWEQQTDLISGTGNRESWLNDGWEQETVALFVGGVPVSSNAVAHRIRI
jgi:hypothetical protein